MVLAKYFIKQVEEGNINLKGKICLELGCGTGMLAIVLACLGEIKGVNKFIRCNGVLQRFIIIKRNC